METEDKTIKELLFEYSKGKRNFQNWAIEEESILLQKNDLSNIFFENCFLDIDFSECILKNTRFINCNIKTINFTNANLTNVEIRNCSVESVLFKGAKTTNLIFEGNSYFGHTLNQVDFEDFKNS